MLVPDGVCAEGERCIFGADEMRGGLMCLSKIRYGSSMKKVST